jgi:hypothetical protein
MKSDEIDRLVKDWLIENYPQDIADQYESQSLLTPALNPPQLNGAIDDMLERLSRLFGAEASFMTTDYQDARAALALPDDRTPIPDVFRPALDESSVNTNPWDELSRPPSVHHTPRR